MNPEPPTNPPAEIPKSPAELLHQLHLLTQEILDTVGDVEDAFERIAASTIPQPRVWHTLDRAGEHIHVVKFTASRADELVGDARAWMRAAYTGGAA